MIYYMDSSCLVKRSVNEIGSRWVLGITNPVAGNEIYTVRITGVDDWDEIHEKLVAMGTDIYNKINESDL